ncbi:MAG TPA: toll/interleukin-1 receptor domain-containing protein [Blastocatellia bacterium]|nr:toll/interleukin-1 receptor domain-containing protein [Blastocatellia bacterium]
MSTDTTQFEIFLSYARRDNLPASGDIGWVTALRDHIIEDHRRFSTEPLRVFLDTTEIRDMDDWRHRILGALRQSRILLVCLSPNYFASDSCRWEWEEYTRRQVHQLLGSESIAAVYFAEAPRAEAQNHEWYDSVLRGNYTDIRPWFSEGAAAFQHEDVQRRLAVLGESLWERIRRARRAEGVPGNLRRQNPYFVGRQKPLEELHTQLGVGAIGVVTALHGLGGQGKTELAVAYAHGRADSYRAGLWVVGAEGKTELLPLIGELAFEPALGVALTAELRADSVRMGRAVLAELERRSAALRDHDAERGAAALVILDNVSEAALLSPAQLATLPRADWLRLVATTRLGPERLGGAARYLALVPVDSLEEDDALALVCDHQPDGCFASPQEENAARQIIRDLGGFTLAVEQVAIYLGLYPDVSPTSFLDRLRRDGLPTTDLLPKEEDVAGRILHQEKQLAVILRSTLGLLEPAARTALEFASLLPPDSVPWPWLRELVTSRHAEMSHTRPGHPDPWVAVRRRLEGMRLLTPADHAEVARIHRLVAAHVRDSAKEGSLSRDVEALVTRRAWRVGGSASAPPVWEMDALLAALPVLLDGEGLSRELAASAGDLSEKVKTYRSLGAAGLLLAGAVRVFQRLADSDPANAGGQRDLSVSLNKLGDLATAQGNLAEAQRLFGRSLDISQRLADSDPANAKWQRDLSVSLNKLGDLAKAQGNLAEAQRLFGSSLDIRQRLADSDPANATWQFDLGISYERLGDLAAAQGNITEASIYHSKRHSIIQRLTDSDPANVGWQRDLSVTLIKLGELATSQGNLAEAQRLFGNSLDISQRLADSDPANAKWERDLSVSLNKLGDLAISQGNLAEAQRMFGRSLDIRQRLADSDPANADWQRDLWVSYSRVASVLDQAGESGAEYWRLAYDVLAGIKRAGLFVSPEDEKFLGQLRRKLNA